MTLGGEQGVLFYPAGWREREIGWILRFLMVREGYLHDRNWHLRDRERHLHERINVRCERKKQRGSEKAISH